MNEVIALDSITDGTQANRGQVVVCGSHGGRFTAAIASRLGLRAVLFFDAGFGLNRAGVAGVDALGDIGMAAAAMDVGSAPIGNATKALECGRLSMANPPAIALGLMPGMLVAEAVERLGKADLTTKTMPAIAETSGLVTISDEVSVHMLDSASMVAPEHAGEIVVTGSHGGLVGGNPARALKADARFAAFNDCRLAQCADVVSFCGALSVPDVGGETY